MVPDLQSEPSHLKEMMAERGVDLDHSTVHRWVLYFSPKLLERFNRRKRQVTRKWNLDETYIKVKGEWLYLYRAIDSNADTVEFYFSKERDLSVAKCFIRKALARHGRPVRITIEQDHRRIKQRTRFMLGFKSEAAASITLSSIELIHMMRKQQGVFANQRARSIKQQFEALAA